MKLVSASQRRAVKSYTRRTSDYNIMDNFNQLPSVMKATSDRITRRLQILADAGLNADKKLSGEKAQLAYSAKCDAAIDAAERIHHV
jgi:hypothetical protein